MKVIRFGVEGVLNSFRVPFFRTYHKSFLAPPKTTIIGMLCNISLKPQKEFFEILENNLIEVSVVIEDIKGKSKDLWSYKTLDKKNRGKSIIRRDKLFRAKYAIYLHINNKKLFNEIVDALEYPKNVPSLGLDDEIVTIFFDSKKDVIELKENDSNIIDSVFLDKGIDYKVIIKDITKMVELPLSNITAIKFKAFDKKGRLISREAKEEFRQVEFINCQIEFKENVKSYIDEQLNNKLIFY